MVLSLNPRFPLIPVNEDNNCRVIGRVIGVVRDEDIPSKEEERMIHEAYGMEY